MRTTTIAAVAEAERMRQQRTAEVKRLEKVNIGTAT